MIEAIFVGGPLNRTQRCLIQPLQRHEVHIPLPGAYSPWADMTDKPVFKRATYVLARTLGRYHVYQPEEDYWQSDDQRIDPITSIVEDWLSLNCTGENHERTENR